MGDIKMTNPSIDWNKDFSATDGPGITGYFEPGWSGEIMVQMTIIVPDDEQDYWFMWWQEEGGSVYQKLLSPGQNDLSFTLGNTNSGFGLVRALVSKDGGTYGVNVTIPEAPVLSVPSGLVANDDEATTNAGTPVTVDVLANDTFNDEPISLADLDGLLTIHTPPTVGEVVVNSDGKITYTPPPGFVGEVEFQYRIALPEPVEGFMCVVPGGDFLIVSMPGDFDPDDYVDLKDQDGNWMQIYYAPWIGGWIHMRGAYIYPRPGNTYTLSQGSRPIKVTDVRSGYVILTTGGSWYFGEGRYPWIEEFSVAVDGEIFMGYASGSSIDWADGASPPEPAPGTSYPMVLSFQDEVGIEEYCGVIAFATD